MHRFQVWCLGLNLASDKNVQIKCRARIDRNRELDYKNIANERKNIVSGMG